MISGNPFRRTFNSSSLDDKAVSFVCLTNKDVSGMSTCILMFFAEQVADRKGVSRV